MNSIEWLAWVFYGSPRRPVKRGGEAEAVAQFAYFALAASS